MKRKKKAISLRWYLLGSFAVFLAVAIAVTWFFQIFLLNFMYERIQRKEIKKAADTLAASIGSENMEEIAYEISMDGNMGIMIYRIESGKATKLLSEKNTDRRLFMIPPERISELYQSVKDDPNGARLTKVTFGGQEVETTFLEEVFPNRPGFSKDGVPPEAVSLLYIRVIQEADGTEYVVFLNLQLLPLDSTVNTLKRQFLWITVILILASVLISVILSNRILRPIRKINKAAEKLGKGNYQADFSEKGYRETQELAKTLNYAAGELSRTDQLQKELIANISHDLRTPLTMIRAYSEVMRDIPGENTPENIQVVIDETNWLSELVTDLLDLSRIQSGTQKPNMEVFDLTELTKEVLGRYDTLIKVQGYRILSETPSDPTFVYADRGMLLQVIYNLINNAINYTGSDKTVTVRETISDGTVRMEILDTGEGIPEEQIPLIWDRYYKVDRVHKTSRIGTGLGLSIVKNILELHRAEYGVESTVGKGSCFWFSLLTVPAPIDQTTEPNE